MYTKTLLDANSTGSMGKQTTFVAQGIVSTAIYISR